MNGSSSSVSASDCRICGEPYNQGPGTADPAADDRRPTFMPGPCGRSICMSCAERYRASEIAELNGRSKKIKCMFCNAMFHSEKHVFYVNRDLMDAIFGRNPGQPEEYGVVAARPSPRQCKKSAHGENGSDYSQDIETERKKSSADAAGGQEEEEEESHHISVENRAEASSEDKERNRATNLLVQAAKARTEEDPGHALGSLYRDTVASHLSGRNLGNKWEVNFAKLKQYQEQVGDCEVPLTLQGGLASWVQTQRKAYKAKVQGRHSTLTNGRQQKLESLGFIWDKQNSQWEQRYNQLLAYRRAYGNCRVPAPEKSTHHFRKLGKWVSNQRTLYWRKKEGRKSQLTDERERRLDDIGFEWRVEPGQAALIAPHQYGYSVGHLIEKEPTLYAEMVNRLLADKALRDYQLQQGYRS